MGVPDLVSGVQPANEFDFTSTSDLTRADYQIMLRRPTPGTDEVPELYLG